MLAQLGLGHDEQLVGMIYLGSVAEDQRTPLRELDTTCVTWHP